MTAHVVRTGYLVVAVVFGVLATGMLYTACALDRVAGWWIQTALRVKS